jgi:Fe-S-cluster-containing dehydrogenase component
MPNRRTFLKAGAATTFSCSALGALAGTLAPPVVILENARGLLVADATRCTGCGRCELACTEFNDGRAQPALARVRVSRNYNFGPRGQQAGVGRGPGEYGNFRILPDTCLQCPHPVPCETACPGGAVVLDAKTGARIVDAARCTGCRSCTQACPWEMMAFDAARGTATKCTLCGGAPECAAACPTGALRHVAWRDLTRAVPVRRAAVAVPLAGSAACSSCHRGRKDGR